MMDQFFSALWQGVRNINKPLPIALVGCSILLFAPSDSKWFGAPFVAFAIGGTVESFYKKHKTKNQIIGFLSSLNEDEKRVLRQQVESGTQTFYLHWEDYHGPGQREGRDIDYRRLGGIYSGLVTKNILSARSDHTTMELHINSAVWDILKRNNDFVRATS